MVWRNVCIVFVSSIFRLVHCQEEGEVLLPPFFKLSPEVNWTSPFYRNGVTLTLNCIVGGTPTPEIKWTFNGDPLDLNRPNVEQSDRPGDGTLIISPATRVEEGVYQCEAYHRDTGRALSDTVPLEYAYLDRSVDTETMDLRLPENHPAVIHCRNAESKPVPVFEWQLTKELIDENPEKYHLTDGRVVIDDEGSLRFAYLDKAKDEKLFEDKPRIYKCKTTNAVVDLAQSSGYTTLTVTQDTGELPFVQLAYTNHPHPEIVIPGIQGKNLRFRCIFSGKPVPDITWSKVNGQLPRGRNNEDMFKTELTITDVQMSDSGHYVCEGVNPQNSSDRASHTFHVRVQALPEFLSEDDRVKNKNVTVGDSMRFNCRATGEPQPDIKWTLDGEPIGAKAHPRMQLSDDGHTLELWDACKTCVALGSDLMVVQCNASNEHGYVYSQGYINVLERTKIDKPPTDKFLAEYKQQSIVMTCHAFTDASTPPSYSWLFKDERLATRGPWQILEDGALNITVANNTETLVDVIGEYTCIATNGYTEDRASAHLHGPDVIPASFPWWILILVFILLLLFFLIVLCCVLGVYWYKTKGDEYNVDEKERQHGHIPEDDLYFAGYHEYMRPEAPASRKPSRADSLSSSIMLIDDGISRTGTLDSRTGTLDSRVGLLDREYSMDSLGRFNEEGSFIGQYATGSRR